MYDRKPIKLEHYDTEYLRQIFNRSHINSTCYGFFFFFFRLDFEAASPVELLDMTDLVYLSYGCLVLHIIIDRAFSSNPPLPPRKVGLSQPSSLGLDALELFCSLRQQKTHSGIITFIGMMMALVPRSGIQPNLVTYIALLGA